MALLPMARAAPALVQLLYHVALGSLPVAMPFQDPLRGSRFRVAGPIPLALQCVRPARARAPLPPLAGQPSRAAHDAHRVTAYPAACCLLARRLRHWPNLIVVQGQFAYDGLVGCFKLHGTFTAFLHAGIYSLVLPFNELHIGCILSFIHGPCCS